MSSEPSTCTSHLSYPAPTPASPPTITQTKSSSAVSTIRKDRLYVGNLHPSVDEYALLQVFSKHGKVSKLDFLFHKTGPMKGKPRGYAFIEYSAKEDAPKALIALHDRLLRGRKLVVTFANETPHPEAMYSSSTLPRRRGATEVARPTALSLVKTQTRTSSTSDKIRALEAKLKQMEDSPQLPMTNDGPKPRPPSSLPPAPASLPHKPIL